MSSIKRNILANLLSKGWSALMGLAFVPLYIKLMGIESYGLVGFYATLQVIFNLLDLGITTTLNREVARYSAIPNKSQEMRNLLRTLEIIYWGLAATICLMIVLAAPIIARDWVHATTLPTETVAQAIMLMGVVSAFQFPLGFYSGGLVGLQRQVLSSALNAANYTLRFAGAVLALWVVSPTIQVFFTWQVIVSVASTIVTAGVLWRVMPASTGRARFEPALLRIVWRFAAGMLGISLTTVLLTQLDKIILSKLLPLNLFGYYSLAGVVAGGIALLTTPVFTALFPRLSQLVALDDQTQLRDTYHYGCQLMSVVILPAAVVLALFAPEILQVWTRNATTVEQTHLLVSILVIGTALNGLMNLPYALQLAHGWTKLVFYINIAAITLLTPLLFILTSLYGAIGAAVIWCVLNAAYVLVSIQLMHRRLLPGEQWRWYTEDVGQPLLAALAVAGLGRWLLRGQLPLFTTVGSVGIIAGGAFVAAALSVPQIRTWSLRQIKRIQRVSINESI